MKFGQFLLVIVIALGAGYAGSKLAARSTVSAEKAESVYDRVMRTGTIRCGYALWPPYVFTKDDAGKMGGFAYDIVEAAAKALTLKVEWAEEVAWGPNIREGLKTGRYDMFCAPLWIQASDGMLTEYTIPFAYSSVYYYTRANDNRFDKGVEQLNSSAYKIAVMDGEQSDTIATQFFPKAQKVSIPALADLSQLMLNVATGKADIVFQEPSIANGFADANPGQLKRGQDTPFIVYPNAFGAKLGEYKMVSMINSAMMELINSGEVDRIIDGYVKEPGIFLPVSKPYNYVPPRALK